MGLVTEDPEELGPRVSPMPWWPCSWPMISRRSA